MNIEGFQVREISEDDLEAVSTVIQRAMTPEVKARNLSVEATGKSFDESSPQTLAERIKGNYFFVATAPTENKLIGVIGLKKDLGSSTHNRVSTFDVDPDFQGKGVGRLLYQQVEATAFSLGCRRLSVSSSLMAEPIYKRWGFIKIREVIYDYGDRNRYINIWMEKDL